MEVFPQPELQEIVIQQEWWWWGRQQLLTVARSLIHF